MQTVVLVGYFALIVILGLIGNSRAFIMVYPITAALVFFLAVLCGRWRISRGQLHLSFLAAGLGVALLLPLSNLATAFELVRGQRGDLRSWERVTETWKMAGRSEMLQDYRDRRESSGRVDNLFYSEQYFDSPFLNRLVVVVYNDNMFTYVRGLDAESRKDLSDISIQKVVALLPSPAIRALGLSVNKWYVNSFSVGDYIAYLAGYKDLGGFKLGSMFAHGFALFSFAFFPLLLISAVFFYALFDSFCFSCPRGTVVSMLILCMCWGFFSFYTYDSLLQLPSFVFRQLPQAVLAYFLINRISRFFFAGEDRAR